MIFRAQKLINSPPIPLIKTPGVSFQGYQWLRSEEVLM